MTTEDLKKLKDKFFTDPDWRLMEELIREYIDPLSSSLNIDTRLNNDQIATEVRGRQIAYGQLDRFLVDSGIAKPRIINEAVSFK